VVITHALGGGFECAALRGRDALKITWDAGANGAHESAAYRTSLEKSIRAPGAPGRTHGDAAKALASAKQTHVAEYHVPYLSHAQMEPLVALARMAEGKMEIWAPTQSPYDARATVAGYLGIDEADVTVNVTLLHNDTNNGANEITVRAKDSLGRTVTEELSFHLAVGSVARFNSVVGTMDFELLDADTPLTVANFLNYQTRYANSIIHRSAKSGGGDDFVIQGGGFGFNNSNQLVAVTTDPPVQSEADPANSNIRGTLAMALPTNNPNGGTSQWFVNMANNSFLDAQDFTVFGRVVGEGMAVADQIHELETFNLVGLTTLSALTDTPLRNYDEFSKTIQGTVSITNGSNIVVGTGTKFTTDIPSDQRIKIGTQLFTVLNVVSDTQLNLVANSTQTQTGVTGQVNTVPVRANYVLMNSISKLNLP
jgi:cyclophilin family peptidyl-prolyl cis-trans isomerase